MHVVRDAEIVTALTIHLDGGIPAADDDGATMRVVATSEENDAALLEPLRPMRARDALPVAPERPESDALVSVLRGTQGWRNGHVTDPHASTYGRSDLIESDIPTKSGDSGSPMVNGCGQLVGFVDLGSEAVAHSMSISASKALEALSGAGH
jgi:S1-C subfamily serine protease